MIYGYIRVSTDRQTVEYNKFKADILPLVNFYIELYEMPESAKIEASSKSRNELLTAFALKITEQDKYIYLVDVMSTNDKLVLDIDSVRSLGKKELDEYLTIQNQLIEVNNKIIQNIQKQQAIDHPWWFSVTS